ncbi:LTA synthase family protein [Sulfurimonas sp.]|uniref:LTA synthase family protein n=1 Tax=Sulfurimonas sp. TaxID=2022749 RepID=UPI002B460605|nr:sulfatase-like hydrolase/transferase [Sulfurimonas sp.]
MFLKLPKILRFLLVFIPSLTFLYVFMRVVFYIVFSDPSSPLIFNDYAQAMWLGFRFDLRMVILMIVPLFFLGGIKWLSPFNGGFFKYFWLVYLGLVFAFYFLFYTIDFGHFAYLHTRVDFTAIRFLENLDISTQMVWESYPVVWISLGVFLVNIIFIFFTYRLIVDIEEQRKIKISINQGIVFGFVAFIILLVGGYSKFSQYPLRWSEAAFSKHAFATQLTYNPIHYFFDTWKNGRVSYDKKEVKKYYSLMSDFLGVKDKDEESLNFKREITPKHIIGKKPNIVIVILESFASYKSSVSNNPIDPSPVMNDLAKNGYFFKNYFTPSTGTARSIYTTVTSLPDVELKGTSSRNPLIVDQHSIAQDFKGYEKSYFIGGSASWGNIRGMLTQSMTNLKLYEEGDYSSPRNDVWGISDIDLFREANKVLVKEKEPFFSVIQTSGNHRPYTIPNDSYGFKVRDDISEEEVVKYGFQSVKEYNSFRFMDYCVGHYMELARKSEYYKNTIFIFWGDHGIHGRTGEHTFVGESNSNLGLGSHRVPFVIYSPLIKEPKVYDTVLSEIDALPTIASMANISYTATTLGRDVFDEEFDNSRYAFTIQHSSNPTIGLVGEKYYFRTKADGTNEALFDIYSDSPLEDHSDQNEELLQKMKDLTFGIYETAKYIPYFNKQADVKK